MIDNFELIKNTFKFDSEYDFYFIQIIQRKKDHKDSEFKLGVNNNNRLIKAYYIYSTEQLDRYKLEIITFCNTFKARAYIHLNIRNAKQLSLEMLTLLSQNIKCDHYNQLSKLYNTVCGQFHHDKNKTWILDIDTKDNRFIELVEDTIENFEPLGFKTILQVPTKQGVHLIVKPFNTSKMKTFFPEIEIHKNNPTILYTI